MHPVKLAIFQLLLLLETLIMLIKGQNSKYPLFCIQLSAEIVSQKYL